MSHLQKLRLNQATTLWNNFTSNFPDIVPFSFNPSLYHFYTKQFKWKPYYFILYIQTEPLAVVPLVNTGKAWVSLPHFSYGGILSEKGTEIFNHTRIIDHIISEISSHNLTSGFYNLNIENYSSSLNKKSEKVFVRSVNSNEQNGFIKTEKVTSILQLPKDEATLSHMISSNLLRKINKAKKSGINIKTGGVELLDDFHKVYSRNIFKLSSLSYSKSFFKNLIESYKYGAIKLTVAHKDDKIVGCGMLASYNGFYENLFFAASNESRKYYVSDFLHWHMINYCIDNNNSRLKNELPSLNRNAYYSFGRSTHSSGVHMYKSHWPIMDYTLFNYSNISNIRNNNWIAGLWGLLPYGVSKPLGAYLIKHIY